MTALAPSLSPPLSTSCLCNTVYCFKLISLISCANIFALQQQQQQHRASTKDTTFSVHFALYCCFMEQIQLWSMQNLCFMHNGQLCGWHALTINPAPSPLLLSLSPVVVSLSASSNISRIACKENLLNNLVSWGPKLLLIISVALAFALAC